MYSSFQSTISKNPFSLPTISILSILMWILTPTQDIASWCVSDYGLWYLVPEEVQSGITGSCIGLFFTSICVFAMMEFSNSLVLLRVNSRIVSTTLAILTAIALCIHKFQPVHIAMPCTMFSLASLFASYQKESPALSFGAHFFISIESLVCPKLIILTIPLWIIQLGINAFNFRCFLASIFGIITPYLFFMTFAIFWERAELISLFFDNALAFSTTSLDGLKESQILIGIFIIVLFVAGTIDFFITKIQDKLRQRTIFHTVIIHGVTTMLFMFFMPQCFNLFLGILIIDTSIICGRFWVITDNKFTNNLFVALSICGCIIYILGINM